MPLTAIATNTWLRWNSSCATCVTISSTLAQQCYTLSRPRSRHPESPVKRSGEPARNEVFPGEVKKVFGRLRPADATLAILVTNRPPSPGLAAQCVESSSNSACREWVYGEALQVPADAESGRRIIRQDNRSVEDLTASVASLVRAFRSDRHFSLGESTARLVSINL